LARADGTLLKVLVTGVETPADREGGFERLSPTVAWRFAEVIELP
jgi:hypothetical protein